MKSSLDSKKCKSPKPSIFIFGGGAWGLALAFALSRKNQVYIISRRDLSAQGISKYGDNVKSRHTEPLGEVSKNIKNQNIESKKSRHDLALHTKGEVSNMESTKQKMANETQNLNSNPHNKIMNILDSKVSESEYLPPLQLDKKDFAKVYKAAIKSQNIESKSYPLCIIAIASAFLRDFLSSADFIKPFFKDMQILAASKGIERDSGAFVSDILECFFDNINLCYLAGPSFAKEVRAGLPCAVVIHSKNKALAQKYAVTFPYFMKTYIQSDVVGAEIAGAYKNVIAIAGGICDGLGLGNNAKASLLSRGLVEMTRFGKFFGARTKTFLGLSGSGDLFLTSNSKMSRNYRVGFALAQNKTLDSILSDLGEVAEGVYSAKSITQIAARHSLYTPIANVVNSILQGGSIEEGLRNLLVR